MKKAVSLFLSILFLCSLAACGGETVSPAQTTAAPEAGTTEAVTEPEPPDGNFEGADFNVLAAVEQWQEFYVAEMNGVDAIFFTGGIGEHNSRLRRRVCENFTYLGLEFDYEANTAWGEDTIISLPESKVKAALVTTDEELVIARDTMHLVQSIEE